MSTVVAFDETLLSYAKQEALRQIAKQLVAKGKGLLSLDETESMCVDRLNIVNMPNTFESRRLFRQVFVSAAPTVTKSLSGVLLHEEAFKQKDDDGILFPRVLMVNGILSGVKLDTGRCRIPGSPDEYSTNGLDGLGQRCAEYYEQLARFAKWRCVYKITSETPSAQALTLNSNHIARFAAICQQNGLVPVLQAEVLTDGNHCIRKCKIATETMLSYLFRALQEQKVFLAGLLLETNMVTGGAQCLTRYSYEQVGWATLDAMRNSVPPSVQGIFFISGGQQDVDATHRLNAINMAPFHRPWSMSFSFARAIQYPVRKVWRGLPENIALAKNEFIRVMNMNSTASQGQIIPRDYNEGDEGFFKAYHELV